MSMYSSRALGSTLGTFSAFAGGGRVIFGPFSFGEGWSSDDFESSQHFLKWVKPYLDQVNRKDLSFDPVSSAVRTKAGTVFKTWKAAADLGSSVAVQYVEQVTGKMNELIARADGLSATHSIGSRSIGNEVARYEAFNEINTTIKQVAASSTKANAAYTAVQGADGGGIDMPIGSSSGAGVNAGHPSDSGVRLSPDAGSGYTSSDALTSTGPGVGGGGSNLLLYGGIAAAALLLLGGGIFLTRRKSMGGYRRKRRSNRSRR